MNAPGRIVGVRHAAVVPEMLGRCYGQTDVATILSHAEAAASVAAALAAEGHRFDRVWSSDLDRCRGLAEALQPLLEGAPHWTVDERLRELNHGTFEGRVWEEIHGTEPSALARWGVFWKTEGPPEGESAAALGERAHAWLAELDSAQQHLLIGHAGVMRALTVVTRELDWTSAMQEPIAHLEPITLR